MAPWQCSSGTTTARRRWTAEAATAFIFLTDELSTFEAQHPVHAGGQRFVVGRHEHRQPLFPRELDEQGKDLLRRVGVEVAGRLVSQQQGGPVGDGAGNGNPLLFTAGELAGAMAQSVPQTHALEQHFGTGRLGVRRRLANFQRVYELPERLIDESHRRVSYENHEAQRNLLRRSASGLGVATLQDLADFYRMSPREAAPRVDELVDAGDLLPVAVEGWSRPAYLASRARIPRRIDGASLLSPFDPLIWFRPRAKRLFNFDYRIEIYVPEAKRRWGYYVLPFRVGDAIVARVDLKADRKNSALLVKSVHYEAAANREETESALESELGALAEWLGLEAIVRH